MTYAMCIRIEATTIELKKAEEEIQHLNIVVIEKSDEINRKEEMLAVSQKENQTLRKKLLQQKADYDLLDRAAIKIRNELIDAKADLERTRDTTGAQTRFEIKSLVEAGPRSHTDENLIQYTHLDSKFANQAKILKRLINIMQK